MGSYGEAWNRAGQDGDEDFDPPNGTYHVIVDTCDIFAGRDGREWCKVLYRILEGDHAGRVFQDFGAAGDHNAVGFRITREKLLMLGLPHDLQVTELADLGEAAGELVGNRAEVGVGHKDGYRNVTVRTTRTGTSDIPDVPGFTSTAASQNTPSSAADDEDIPFVHDGFPTYVERRAHASRW